MNAKYLLPWLNFNNVIFFALGVLTMYLLLNTLVDSRFQNLESATRLKISEQKVILTTISETTARNGADAVTESIVRDCAVSERSQFDTMLGKLNNNLTHEELVQLERLFGRCGSFYSERKSMMVARFAREIEVYKTFVDQLTLIMDEDQSDSFSVEQWQSLVAEEKKQSEAFNRLVILQDNIISTLLEGKSPNSPEMQVILQEVRETQELQLLANTQAGKFRTSLVSL